MSDKITVSKEIKNNDNLYRKLMNLSEQDTSKFTIIIPEDKTKVYAAGFLQGVDVMFYLLNHELGLTDHATHQIIKILKNYIDGF